MSVADAAIADFALTPVNASAQVETTIQKNARTLFAIFGQVESNEKTIAIVRMAEQGMPPSDYDAVEAAAIEMARKADEAMGWKPAADAKGTAKYGPKRQSMMVQASMRRQIFGAVRAGGISVLVSVPENGIVNPDTFPGFVEATSKARAYLQKHNINWKGEATEDARRDKATRKESAEFRKQRQASEDACPMQAGETIADWQKRVNLHMESRAESQRQKTIRERAQALFAEFGVAGSLELADALMRLADPQDAPF